MNLTVLVENNTIIDKYLKGEPALSFLIEDNVTKILFDTGYSNLLLENAEKLNICLQDIDYIILSHGHNDHTGGLEFLLNFEFDKKVKLIAHPNTFIAKTDFNGSNIGSPVKIEDLKQKFDLILTSKPLKVTDNIIFLGEIPRKLSSNEAIGTTVINNKTCPDFLFDDTAIVYKNNNNLVIITGCSHSGIENIVDYAQKVTSTETVKSIIGGFHLIGNCHNEVKKVCRFLNNKKVQSIYPCHCTGLYAKCELAKYFCIKEVGSGFTLDI